MLNLLGGLPAVQVAASGTSHVQGGMMKSKTAYAIQRLHVSALVLFLASAASALMAQPANQPNKAIAFKPSATQIERAITSLLLCDWMDKKPQAVAQQQETQAVLDYIHSQRDPNAQDDGRLQGRFQALGVTFDAVDLFAGQGGAFAMGWTTQGSMQTIAKALEQRGYTLVPKSLPVGRLRTVAGFEAVSITPSRQISVVLSPGRGSFAPNSWEPEGVTLSCGLTSPSAEHTEKAIGVPTTLAIQGVVQKGERKPKEWVDNIIAKGFAETIEAVSGYRWLEASQVNTLLGRNQPTVDKRLAYNKGISLSPEQIQMLLDRNNAEVLRALVQGRIDALSAEQRTKLKANPATQEAVLLRSSPAEALLAFERIVNSGDRNRVNSAMYALPNVSNEMVDLLIDKGTPDMRYDLSMQSKHAYTPQQVDKLLRDPNPSVKVGVLRRDEVPITRQQYDAGINHTDSSLAFWYRAREEHMPSAAQIELGLTSPDAPTRAGWIFDKRVTLTEAQTKRALNDPSLFVPVLARPEVKLTEQDFDRCTVHQEVEIRFACVSRADYPLTQTRFEAIVADWNTNVLRNLLDRQLTTPVDYGPYIAQALDTASEKVVLAIGKFDALPVSDELIRKAAGSRSAAVRQAFCSRKPALCRQ
jgi:hypothetical protein